MYTKVLIAATTLTALGVTTVDQAVSVPSPRVTMAMCRPAGHHTQSGVTAIRLYLQSHHPVTQATVQSLGLAGSGGASVTVVSDETACTRGSSLVDSIAGLGVTANPVYAYQIATSHWVIDPARYNPVPSEVTRAYVFDSLWTFRGTLALPGVGGRR